MESAIKAPAVLSEPHVTPKAALPALTTPSVVGGQSTTPSPSPSPQHPHTKSKVVNRASNGPERVGDENATSSEDAKKPKLKPRRHSRQQLKVLNDTWGSTFVVMNEGQSKAEKRRAQKENQERFLRNRQREDAERRQKARRDQRGSASKMLRGG